MELALSEGHTFDVSEQHLLLLLHAVTKAAPSASETTMKAHDEVSENVGDAALWLGQVYFPKVIVLLQDGGDDDDDEAVHAEKGVQSGEVEEVHETHDAEEFDHVN
jgi:hypothetical protein